MPFLSNKGVQIFYTHAGDESAPPLLFCNGYGPASRYIENFYMPSFLDRFRCATFDIRGIGQSEEPADDSEFTLEKLGSDALAVMDAMGWESAHLWGVSMGTVIACSAALLAPKRIRSLTLNGFDTGAPNLVQRKYADFIRVRYDYFTMATRSDLSPREKAERMLSYYGPIHTPVGQRIVEYYTEMVQQKRANRRWTLLENIVPFAPSMEALEASLPETADPIISPNPTQIHHRVHEISAPTLILHGYKDPLITVDAPIHAFKRMPNAELRIYKDVMHSFSFRPDILVEECDWIAKREAEFQRGAGL